MIGLIVAFVIIVSALYIVFVDIPYRTKLYAAQEELIRKIHPHLSDHEVTMLRRTMFK